MPGAQHCPSPMVVAFNDSTIAASRRCDVTQPVNSAHQGEDNIMKYIKLNMVKFWQSIILATTIAFVSAAYVRVVAQGTKKALPNIVLVHGAWADGSSWSGVIQHLQKDGYTVVH